ncbi:DUF2793 domain-containing protein [Microvirga sp. 17 mud 1-3]|uniref:DUF2793 domain-containing protein n=1 Tax=Microvirga sp. 17 mud 1-3 TaxID=2082949 RepID=UPI000D6AAB13|nr:DUF2793 domain-containing protein [Microvirga sp. 17 mud 1-3]AWM87750.1 hypothetical protein C4E04_14090 [Microvirga sp. 17 mud 1-3]
MSTTPHLALPLLAAAQAQKHVTHNEAIALLDALVQLSVRERNRESPPADPTEGDRYLVGTGASGGFAGHGGEIALFDLGIWRFFAPHPGWRAYVEAEDVFLLFGGTDWKEIGHYVRSLGPLDRLGIGTDADDLNRLAARLNAVLLDARRADQGGTDDLRLVLNKPDIRNVLSLLWQTDYGGRAEAGLIGNEDFSLRVSSDGLSWRDAMMVDRRSGIVSFPCGTVPLGTNLFMNPGFTVNQRGYAGGPLSTGSYGFDRWRAGSGGLQLSRGADGTMTFQGSLEQTIDVTLAETLLGAPDFSGRTLTLSVEDLSAPLAVTIGTREAVLPAGAGRTSVTVTLDMSETGHLRTILVAGGTATFRRIKLEIGTNPTPWLREPAEIEEMRCRRYYQRLSPIGAPGVLPALGQRRATNLIDCPVLLPVPMRATPTVVTNAFSWIAASPTSGQFAFLDGATGTWLGQSGGVTVTTMAASPSSAILRLQAGTAFSGSAGAVGSLHLGASAHIGLQAEI